MVHSAIVKHLGCCVTRSSQSVHQEDGSSPLHVVGETCLTFTHESHEFTFEGLAVTYLDVDVLAGTLFMEEKHFSVRPAKRQVIVGAGPIYSYWSQHPTAVGPMVRRATVLRSPPTSTII